MSRKNGQATAAEPRRGSKNGQGRPREIVNHPGEKDLSRNALSSGGRALPLGAREATKTAPPGPLAGVYI